MAFVARLLPKSCGAALRTLTGSALAGSLTVGAAAAGQMPAVQNGTVETRQASSPELALKTVAGGGPDPVWIGWIVPMVGTAQNLCSQWTPDVWNSDRLALLETTSQSQPAARPVTPVRREGGSTLVLLARVVAGRVERLRTLDDECPIDAGGRSVVWFTGITPAASVRYLDGLVREASTTLAGQRRQAASALSAIALHRDPAADAPLERLVAPEVPNELARQAAMLLGAHRGAHGFAALQTRIAAERDPRVRRTFVTALGQTREPGTSDALLALARTDADAGVRAEAVHWYAARGREAALANVLGIIAKDTDDGVKRRAVTSLGVLPADSAVPALIQLARTGPSPVVRKEAVSTLGRSSDARARTFLEELVTR